MRIKLDLDSIDSYRLFLRIKSLPSYRFVGREAWIPDEYAPRLGLVTESKSTAEYEPWPDLFDYQAGCARLAIEREKFAIFARCGIGKTLMAMEYARHVLGCLPREQCGLIVAPLMVVPQFIEEAVRFYGDALPIERIPSNQLASWLTGGTSRLGITNYEAMKSDLPQGRLGMLAADESSTMKSHYGKWGQALIGLGRGLRWKLCMTGTPAPNDRIEYANHAVHLDAFPTVNSFLAKFFVNRGQTESRWEMKPHALRPFYRALSHWCIFLTNPATYGWEDNTAGFPPVEVHIHDVELTAEQDAAARGMTGMLFPMNPGGITSRTKLARIAKGRHDGEAIATRKPGFIKSLVDSWPGESTIIWAKFNDEQDALARLFPDAANIDGSTPMVRREELIADFKAGRRKMLISKVRVLGFGLNLHVCSQMIFSSLQDSYEEYHQAVSRANRYGSTHKLHVHIPVTELERPMVSTVIVKAHRIDHDTMEQEALFRELSAA